MPKKELSQRLMDAYMIDDMDAVKEIQSEIASVHKTIITRAPHVYETPLSNQDSSAIELYEFMNKIYGSEWWEWEHETIDKMVFFDYHTVMSERNSDMLYAVKFLCNSDEPFSDWYYFNQLSLAFCGAIADFETMRPVSPGMVIACVKIMNYIRPDREKKFSDSVISYISTVLIDAGIYYPPMSIGWLVSKRMRELVSDESVSMWPKIKSEYAKVVSDTEYLVTEEAESIQARRLVVAEAAAVEIYN